MIGAERSFLDNTQRTFLSQSPFKELWKWMRPKINQKVLFERVIKRREQILDAEKDITDSELCRRPAQTYTDVKLGILRKYLYSYSAILSNSFDRFWYVETCAGPGVCRVRDSGRLILGSPLLAMSNEPAFTGYRFIECNYDIATALKERQKLYFPALDAKVVIGDCNNSLEKVLAQLPSNDHVLIVMDPEGLELKWEKTVVPAAKMKNSELFINFPFDMAMKRCMESTENALTECMGTDRWVKYRDQYKSEEISFQELRETFLRIYVEGLQNLGLTEVQPSHLVRSDNHNPLYYLISASRKPVAKNIMKDIMNVDVTTQTTLGD
jgi:three-Cys-motif partner protein